MTQVVAGNNAFAFDLYGKLKGQEGNLFLSPFSISTALAMTCEGARGETETQMAKVLHFEEGVAVLHEAFGWIIKDVNGRGRKNYELSVANALWAQKNYTLRKEYVEVVRKGFGAGLENVDFVGATEEARKTINAWVEKQTKEKIKELIQPGVLNERTRLVLTNAIYFKGKWAQEFDKKLTKDEVFHVAKGKDVRIPMMHQDAEFRYGETDGCQVLELPYRGDEMTMVVFLPKEVAGLGKLEERLTLETLNKWTEKMGRREVEVLLPRFKMEGEFSLKDVLIGMGMTDAFDPGKADFKGMTGEEKDLYVSAVVHKAYVDVNEEGTEAAAATGVVMKTQSIAPEPPVVFKADHPFVFVIRDRKTGSILFMGRVVDPSKGG